jgi:hypothetical protein
MRKGRKKYKYKYKYKKFKNGISAFFWFFASCLNFIFALSLANQCTELREILLSSMLKVKRFSGCLVTVTSYGSPLPSK